MCVWEEGVEFRGREGVCLCVYVFVLWGGGMLVSLSSSRVGVTGDTQHLVMEVNRSRLQRTTQPPPTATPTSPPPPASSVQPLSCPPVFLQIVKVWSEDGAGKVVEIPADMTARDVCQLLVYKNHCLDDNAWTLVEHHPVLGLGRKTTPPPPPPAPTHPPPASAS